MEKGKCPPPGKLVSHQRASWSPLPTLRLLWLRRPGASDNGDGSSCFHSLSHAQLFTSPWTAACQAFLSFTISQSLLKLMCIESVMPSNHLILCCPLLLLPSIFPSIRVFSNESALHIRWPSIGASTSASVLPMNIQD